MTTDLRRSTALLPLAVVVVVAAVLIATGRPSGPSVGDPVARAVPVGSIDPDRNDPGAPDGGPRSPHGQACLERIQRETGYLDLCWSVDRDPGDADATKDYYLLHLYGTHGGGIRSMVVRSDLVGTPGDGVLSVWPTGTIEGPCELRDVTLGGYDGTLQGAHVCGKTVGELEGATWSHTVTWTCECVPGEQVDRGFDSYLWLGVPAGTIPSWDLYAEASLNLR
jgi:hypothetical protein